MIRFYDGGVPVPDRSVPNIFAFCVLMAACVAARRGGRPSDYIAECADFMADVIGKRLSIRDQLPGDYDWRPSAAADCAHEMMGYDQ